MLKQRMFWENSLSWVNHGVIVIVSGNADWVLVFWQHDAFLSEALTTATDGKLEINVPTEYD